MGIVLALLLAVPVMAQSPWNQTGVGVFQMGKFCGLNDTDSPASIPDCAAKETLNFESDKSGTALLKRLGISLQGSLTVSTSPVRGSHRYSIDAGDDLVIACNDTHCYKSVNRGSFAVFLGTASSGIRWWSIVSVDGDAYLFNDKRDEVAKYDGTTLTYPAGLPRGKVAALLPDRLVVANTAANPNRVSYSKSGEFEEFTTGPEAEDAFTDDLGAPGEEVTALTAWLGDLLVFKPKSITFCEVGDQYTTKCSVITDNIGVSAPGAVVQAGEDLLFEASDGSYWKLSRRDGMRPISESIKGFLQAKTKGSNRSNTQTTQTDWEAGVDFPDGGFSTTISPGSITNSSVTVKFPGLRTNWEMADVDTTTLSNSYSENFDSETSCSSSCDFGGGKTWTVLDGAVASPVGSLSNGDTGTQSVIYHDFTQSTGAWSFVARTTGTQGGFYFNFRFSAAQPASATDFKGTHYGIYPNYKGSLSGAGTPNIEIRVINAAGGVTASTNTGVLSKLDLTGGSPDNAFHTYLVTQSSGYISLFLDGEYLMSYDTRSLAPLPPSTHTYTLLGFCQGGECARSQFDSIRNPQFYEKQVSTIYDTTFSTPIYGNYSFSGSSHVASSVTFYVQASNTDDGTGFSDFETVTLTDRLTTLDSGKRYVRHRITPWPVTFEQTERSTVTASQLVSATTATYRTQCIQPGTGITAWGTLNCAENLVGNGSIVYYATSAATCAGLPAGDPTTWLTTETNNATLTIDTDAAMYVGFRSLLGSATDQAQIDACTVNWQEGTPADATWSVYHPIENSVYWTAQTSASTRADRLIKYDLSLSVPGQDVFWPLDLDSGPLLFYDNHIHFGASDGGKWFKYAESGQTSDEGAAINATWKSKDYSLGAPFQEKTFNKLSILSGNEQKGTVSVTWGTERFTGENYSISLSTSSSYPYIRDNRALKKKSPATHFNLQITNNSADNPVRIFGWGLEYGVHTWRPMTP